MIGQVATLRDGVTTIAELHDEVTEGAARLARGAAGRRRARSPRPQPRGRRDRRHGDDPARARRTSTRTGPTSSTASNGITEVPRRPLGRRATSTTPTSHERRRRRRRSGAASSTRSASTRSPTASRRRRWPRSSRCSCWRSRSRRRRSPTPATRRAPFDRERTSVIFGAEAGTDLAGAYGFRAHLPAVRRRAARRRSTRCLPSLTEDSFPGILANVIAGRIANRLDLGGVELHGRRRLRVVARRGRPGLQGARDRRRSDMVICGGADLHNGINDYLVFASVHALSPDAAGAARSTPPPTASPSARASRCVVLKRLADAERDGDRIYAVIKGVGGASDGKSLGLTAPRTEGQQRAAARAPTHRPASRRARSAWSRRTAPAPSSATAPSSRRSPSFFAERRRDAGQHRARLGQVADRPHQVRGRPRRD